MCGKGTIARGRAVEENCLAAPCADDAAAVVAKGAIARGRGAEELRLADRWAVNAPPLLGLLVKVVRLPAVALFVNAIVPMWPAPSIGPTKFCMIPELFVMPTPLMVNVNVGLAVIVKALAPALNTMPFTSVLAEMETPVVFERANVAVFPDPIGRATRSPVTRGVPIVGRRRGQPACAAGQAGLSAEH